MLFGPLPSVTASVLLSNVKTQFQASISRVDDRLYEAVTKAGLFACNPQTTRRIWTALGVAVIVAGALLLVVAMVTLGAIVGTAWLPGTALVLVGTALTLVAGSMPRRTQLGALEAARWRAFSAHLKEVARGEKPGTALPSHYLPYAVAFGIDTAYVKHLESVGTPPPRWYQPGPPGMIFLPGGWYGSGWSHAEHRGGSQAPTAGGAGGGIAAPPNPQGWSDALAALLNAASEAMAHGGGSGGWSGGGFGGGRGGGGGSGGFR